MRLGSSYYKRKYSYSNKKNYAILILFITLFFGVGYAYLNTLLTINGTATVHKNTWDVHFENIVKVDGSVDASSEATITGDTAVDFTVDLELPSDVYSFTVDVVNDGTIDAMLSEVLKNGLTTEQEAYVEYTVTYSDGEEILSKDALPSGKQDQLLVLVKYKDDITADDLPSEDQSIVLNLSTDYIQDDGTSTDRRTPRYLYNEILAQNQENGVMVLDNEASTYVSASTGIDFNVAPSDTNGKGVYVRNGTESDTYPIYYYRGAVTNNNVIFGGFCWKIVRTTETGGIKLIYNGSPTYGACNNTGEASQIGAGAFNNNYWYNAYVGYMYGTPNSSTYAAEHLSTKTSTSSTIKTYIDEWYSNNMTKYTSYLEDTIWCNDRSFASSNTGTGAGTSETYYGAYGRNRSNPTPSLECVNQNDRFTVNETMEGRIAGNGALTYPVALLTADEATLAGNGKNGYSKSNYLATGQDWWSMSPYQFYNAAFEFYVLNALYYKDVDYSSGVRPSVSLLLGTEIESGGDGSVNSPFVVEAGEKTIIIEGNDDIRVNLNKALPNQNITLFSKTGDNIINSFKLNGELIEGSSFTMPDGDAIITEINVTTKGTITIEGNSDVSSSVSKAFAGTTVTLLSKSGRSSINSFKMNGELVEGISFIMPEGDVLITDIDVTEPTNSLYEILVNRNKEMDGVMVLDNQSSTYVSASTGIDFNVAPSDTNGKGVYVRNGTESDTYPIYYYRGEVTNNNVLFANYCWKIVRTTETGGIKLIYNGVSTDGTCNNTGEDSQIGTSAFNSSRNYNANVGYMYGTPGSSTYAEEHANINNSTIKTAIDTWYAANMASYTDKLEDTVWCNDRSFASTNRGTGAGTSETNYGAHTRNYGSSTGPSLECVNQNDRFTVNETMEGRIAGNGALTYPVALLTADEATLAGNGKNGYSKSNYLATGLSWWSLSPSVFLSSSANEFYVGSSGSLNIGYVIYTNGVRPSVSLLHGTEIESGGDGSTTNPFVAK